MRPETSLMLKDKNTYAGFLTFRKQNAMRHRIVACDMNRTVFSK